MRFKRTATMPAERTKGWVSVLAQSRLLPVYRTAWNVQGVLRMIVMESKRPCRPAVRFVTPSNRWVYHSGARRLPIPKDMAAARVNRFRLVQVM